MFGLRRATAAAIEERVAAARGLAMRETQWLAPEHGLKARRLPVFFARDSSESSLGYGDAAFGAARAAFARWAMFDLGWVRVANPAAAIERGAVVAVEAHTLGLWTLNLSRITEVVDRPGAFGFIYKTTALHVEEGEERFLLTLDAATGEVRYRLEAVSRPGAALARLGLPVTRAFQRRFARDSHARMRSEVNA